MRWKEEQYQSRSFKSDATVQRDTGRRAILRALMAPFVISEVKEGPQICQVGHGRIVHEIHMLILDRPPQVHDEDIVWSSAAPTALQLARYSFQPKFDFHPLA